MRKFSELYGLVLELIEYREANFICSAIIELDITRFISHDEFEYLLDDFKSTRSIAESEFNARRISIGWWPTHDTESRIAFLKHLIKLCKEQDI